MLNKLFTKIFNKKVHTLTNRRHLEPCIAYAESHD